MNDASVCEDPPCCFPQLQLLILANTGFLGSHNLALSGVEVAFYWHHPSSPLNSVEWLSVAFSLLAVPDENILLGLPFHLPRHDIPDVAGACPFSGLRPGVGGI